MTPPQPTPPSDPRQDPDRRWARQHRAHTYADFSGPSHPPTSQRRYAQEHAIPRSTLGDWLRAPVPGGVEPQAVAFFRSPAGERFLRQLVLALLLVFRQHCPRGLRPLGLFLELCCLDRFVAASYGALFDLDRAVQRLLVAFGADERQQLACLTQGKAIVVCPDEHFHTAHPCLVAIEPCSDFILAETYRDRRDAATWAEVLGQATADLPVRIVLSCSDEAKGLICCAQSGLGVPHAPDLFHQQRTLTGPVLSPLRRCIHQAQQELGKAQQRLDRVDAARDASVPAEQRGTTLNLAFLDQALDAAKAQLLAQGRPEQARQQHEQARQAVRELGDAYHPFDAQAGRPPEAVAVKARLEAPVRRLGELVQTAELGEKAEQAVGQASGWLAVPVGCVAWCWAAVRQRVQDLGLSAAAEEQVVRSLLPGLYWQQAARRARQAGERDRLGELGRRLQEEAWSAAGALGQLRPAEREEVERVARECAGPFGRSSSCVEGRNGRLSLFGHGQGPLREQRLEALTATHNYVVRRSGGSTAAERFFGVKQRDAFAWLLQRLPELPRPAAKRPRGAPPSTAQPG